MSELRAFNAGLAQAARDAGAVDVEVLSELVIRRAFQDGAQGRARGRPFRSTTVTLRVRDGRGAPGLVTATDPSPGALVELARSAVARAGAAQPDPLAGPPERLDVAERGLGIQDVRLPTIEDADRAEVPQSNVEGATGVADGIVAARFSYVEEQRERALHSSNGVIAVEPSTCFLLEGVVQDERTGVTLTDSVQSRHFADVASVPLGVDLARRLAAFRTEAAPPPGECALLLSPVAVARLLPALVPAFAAEAIEAGRSFLSGRLGQRVASARLHLIDDPGLSGALRTRAFDDRGVPPMAVPLLREGMSGGVYLGPELARSRGLRPTGHRRADGGLWPGNLVLRPGSRSRNMLLPDLGRHLAVDDFLDLDGIDLARGTLDLPVRTLVMNGPEVVGCAGVARLTCAIPTLLQAVTDLCSDQERIRDVDACTWITHGLALRWG